jgi:hypothetical protein
MTIVAFVLANKALIGAIAVAVLSEVAPFLPTKWNGLAQALVLALKKKPAPAMELPEDRSSR